ncbi:MAG: hypothetical protein AAF986_11555, partial [Pseudomonadota bacterium]
SNNSAVSTGLVRGQVQQHLQLVGGSEVAPSEQPSATSSLAIPASLNGSTALKLSPMEEIKEEAGLALKPEASLEEQRVMARAQGYEGENCSECGNFTMVRNGTCLKCVTCGSTSGCS